MNKVDAFTAFQIRNDIPDFSPGDSVAVQVKVIEGDKERIQTFEGVVIQKRGSGIHASFTVSQNFQRRRRGAYIFDQFSPHCVGECGPQRACAPRQTVLPARSYRKERACQ